MIPVVPLLLLGGVVLWAVSSSANPQPARPTQGPPRPGGVGPYPPPPPGSQASSWPMPQGAPQGWTVPPLMLPGTPTQAPAPSATPRPEPTTEAPGNLPPDWVHQVTDLDPATKCRVFKEPIAAAIVSQLVGYSTRDAGSGLVKLEPATAAAAERSALVWAAGQNRTHTLFAPVYMAYPELFQRVPKYLRAAPRSEERLWATDDPRKVQFAILAVQDELWHLLVQIPGASELIKQAPNIAKVPALKVPDLKAPPLNVPPLPKVVTPTPAPSTAPAPPTIPTPVPAPSATPAIPTLWPTPMAKAPDVPLEGLPDPIKGQVMQLLTAENIDPEGLDYAANTLDQGGFHQIAAKVRSRAAELRARKGVTLATLPGSTPVEPTSPTPTPATPNPSPTGGTRVLQKGDTAWGLAQQMTGEGARWRELLPVNPGLKEVAGVSNGKPTVFVRPWNPGQIVRIPPSWTSKPGAAATPVATKPPTSTTKPKAPAKVPPGTIFAGEEAGTESETGEVPSEFDTSSGEEGP